MKPITLLTTAAAVLLTGAAYGAAKHSAKPAAKPSAKPAAMISAPQAAASKWLALVDAGDLAGSWQQSASGAKAVVTEAQWVDTVGPVRNALGNLKHRALQSGERTKTLPGAPDGDYAVLKYHTAFVKKAAATETVILSHEGDGAWRVTGYFIK